MPSSIGAIQKSTQGIDFGGESKDKFELVQMKNEFEKFGSKFLKELSIQANNKKVVASGNMLKDAKYRMTDNGMTMQIIMPNYFDYPNEGVRGWGSSKNAPGSPYKYKSKKMNDDGRESIKKYIKDGHAKINTVLKSNDKALGIGREKKHLSLIDVQTNQLEYLIKKYGIKKTGFFTAAINATFDKEFELKMVEALGKDIVFSIEKIKR